MSLCLLHGTLASICGGPHCPTCGELLGQDRECIAFVRREVAS